MKYIYRLSVLVISSLIIVICFSFNTESILSKLKSLSYLIRLIDNYYVEDVDLNKIIDGAMHGMLYELDPHSQYITSEELNPFA